MCAANAVQFGTPAVERKEAIESKETAEAIFQKIKVLAKLSAQEQYAILKQKDTSALENLLKHYLNLERGILSEEGFRFFLLQHAVEKGDAASKPELDKMKAKAQELFDMDPNVFFIGGAKINLDPKIYSQKTLSYILGAAIFIILTTNPEDVIFLPGRSLIHLGHAIELIGKVCPKLFRRVYMPAFSSGGR